MPKRFLTMGLILSLVSALHSQSSIAFSTEEYFGGGIGYTPTFLFLNVAEAFPFNAIISAPSDTGLLGAQGLGFSPEDVDELSNSNMFVIHGAEGFGNVSGNWRIGAYVGLGARDITSITGPDTARLQTDLKVSLMTGNASIEYVIPLFSNLEIAAGSLFGMSRATIQFSRRIDIPNWNDQFTFTGIDSSNYSVSLSGTFFAFQPYIAVKLQFMDRAGLRISGGYNVATLPTNQWKLNDFGEIKAPSESVFDALAVRVMLYLGI